MTIWEEKEGVWSAQANGFVYEIYPPLPGTKSGLWIFTRGATLLRGYDSLGTIEGQKITAQAFAKAIADAVSEELSKRNAESRKQRRRDCEFTFKGIPTEVLEQKVMVISRPTLEMVEILRRTGREMVNGKIVPLPDDEARK